MRLAGVILRVSVAALAMATAVAAEAQELDQRALLDRYCVTCHNERLRTAELQLDTAVIADVAADPALWEKVARKLRAGAMPPAPRPRPDEATYANFIGWLESELDAAAVADPDPGRTEAFHRLNRAEYRNVIRDLLALDVDVAELLPADDGSYGFDNIAGVLGVSPTLLERYLSAAKKVSRLAVGNPHLTPTAMTYRLAADYAQDDRVDGLPFGTRGGMAIPFVFRRTRSTRSGSGSAAIRRTTSRRFRRGTSWTSASPASTSRPLPSAARRRRKIGGATSIASGGLPRDGSMKTG